MSRPVLAARLLLLLERRYALEDRLRGTTLHERHTTVEALSMVDDAIEMMRAALIELEAAERAAPKADLPHDDPELD